VPVPVPVPVPELVPLLRAPVATLRYSLARGSDDARRSGQSTVCCVTVLSFLSSRLQRGMRRASAAWVLKREGGARRLLARWVWCLYKAFVDQGPGAQRRVNAGCSWQLEAGSGKVPGGLTSSGSGAWAWPWPWAWRGIHSA
jgi:hypothetical protein